MGRCELAFYTVDGACDVAGSYRGQWLQGSRHGFGIRQSVPYGVAVHYRHQHKTLPSSSSQSSVHTPTSVDDYDTTPAAAVVRRPRSDDGRGGFVLVTRSDPAAGGQSAAAGSESAGGPLGFRGAVARTLRLRKQASAGEGTSTSRMTGRRAARDGSGSRSASEDRDSTHTDSCTSFVSQVRPPTPRACPGEIFNEKKSS